jgi:hypothetical protein
MALQKQINLENFGLELPESYHKIDDVRITDKNVFFTIKVYASQAARNSSASPLNVISMTARYEDVLTHEGDELFAKLYAMIRKVDPAYRSPAVLDV